MKTREELRKLISETKLGEDWAKYKCIRNKVNNRLKYEESCWQKARWDACGDNSVKTLREFYAGTVQGLQPSCSTRDLLRQRLKI